MSLQDVVSNLRAEIETSVDSKPMVKVHAKEWEKVRLEPPNHRAPTNTDNPATNQLFHASHSHRTPLAADHAGKAGRN